MSFYSTGSVPPDKIGRSDADASYYAQVFPLVKVASLLC